MKKTLFIIICVITAIVICSCGNVKYSSGRDTLASFGDGTYQIGQTHTHKRILKNLEYNVSIVPIVYAYYENDSHLYVTGTNTIGDEAYWIFACINIKNNYLEVYTGNNEDYILDLSEFDEDKYKLLTSFVEFEADKAKQLQSLGGIYE